MKYDLGIQFKQSGQVTPLAGVWIEITDSQTTDSRKESSLPSRECGLKFDKKTDIRKAESVTPLAGVWIEIDEGVKIVYDDSVTPLAGVWIEIPDFPSSFYGALSLPSRECGLKFESPCMRLQAHCHSPRGSVD